jgi:hypothetical protein
MEIEHSISVVGGGTKKKLQHLTKRHGNAADSKREFPWKGGRGQGRKGKGKGKGRGKGKGKGGSGLT